MLKSKLLLGLAIMAGVLATAAATPALAEWQSLSTTTVITTGKVAVINGGQWAAIFGGIEANVKCAPGPIIAEWQIRASGKILDEFTGAGQRLTKLGPHDQLVIKSWGSGKNGSESCNGEAAGIKEPAEVAPCVIQLHQRTGVTKGVLSDQVRECLIKTFACEVKIPPVTKEVHGENWQLGEVTLENKGTNQNAKGNITGLKATAGGEGCSVPGETSKAELKELEWEQVGMKAI